YCPWTVANDTGLGGCHVAVGVFDDVEATAVLFHVRCFSWRCVTRRTGGGPGRHRNLPGGTAAAHPVDVGADGRRKHGRTGRIRRVVRASIVTCCTVIERPRERCLGAEV